MPHPGLGRPAPPRRRGPIIALAIATIVVVPLVIRDMISEENVVSPGGTTTTVSSPATTAPTTAGSGGSDAAASAPSSVPPLQVPIDPRWVAKGWSRYSEDDETTQTRITKNNMAGTTLPPPTTRPPATSAATPTTKVPRTTAPPVSEPAAAARIVPPAELNCVSAGAAGILPPVTEAHATPLAHAADAPVRIISAERNERITPLRQPGSRRFAALEGGLPIGSRGAPEREVR